MGNLLQSLMGMGDMTEQVIATDFLISAKTGVRNYAMAIAETATPEVREVLRRQLEDAIDMHEKIATYMMDQGYYHIKDFHEQLKLDIKEADSVLRM